MARVTRSRSPVCALPNCADSVPPASPHRPSRHSEVDSAAVAACSNCVFSIALSVASRWRSARSRRRSARSRRRPGPRARAPTLRCSAAIASPRPFAFSSQSHAAAEMRSKRGAEAWGCQKPGAPRRRNRAPARDWFRLCAQARARTPGAPRSQQNSIACRQPSRRRRLGLLANPRSAALRVMRDGRAGTTAKRVVAAAAAAALLLVAGGASYGGGRRARPGRGALLCFAGTHRLEPGFDAWIRSNDVHALRRAWVTSGARATQLACGEDPGANPNVGLVDRTSGVVMGWSARAACTRPSVQSRPSRLILLRASRGRLARRACFCYVTLQESARTSLARGRERLDARRYARGERLRAVAGRVRQSARVPSLRARVP